MLSLLVGLVLVPWTLAQFEFPITGKVTTKDGVPVSGVSVYGSIRQQAPATSEQTVTDERGYFRLVDAGRVIHFWKENLQPQSLVLNYNTPDVRVVMEPVSNALRVPSCIKPKPGEKFYGYSFKFSVPKRAVTVEGGKWDVDYVCYGFVPKSGKSLLRICFAGNVKYVDPYDELLMDSADFTQRNLILEAGKIIGRDSFGHLKGGESWRMAVVTGGGGMAVYRSAPAEEAILFDRIINSICAEAPQNP